MSDSKGFYDVQYSERDGFDGKGVLKSDENGNFWFKAIIPVPYPIPHDGPVGKLLKVLNRHPMRPSHMHFVFEKPGYDNLITYDWHIFSSRITDENMVAKYNVEVGIKLLMYDFVLFTYVEAEKLRRGKALEAMTALGWKMKLYNGLPVTDVD